MSRATIWSGMVANAVLPVVEWRYRLGSDLDMEWFAPGVPRAVEVAQVLSGVLAVPDRDSQLIAVCRRDGLQAPWGAMWTLGVVDDRDERYPRVGVVTPAGVVESAGEHLGLVLSPEAGRYREWFFLPGVTYVGGGVA